MSDDESGGASSPSVRALLRQNAEWGQRLQEPEPEPELSAAASSGGAAGRGESHPDVRIVGARAGQRQEKEVLYKWDDELEDPANEETDSLFQLFVVVGLKAGAPAVYYRYDAEETDHQTARAFNGIENFCYPNTLEQPRKSMRPETFTFVLTNPMGGRRIGFCRRYLPGGGQLGARYAEVGTASPRVEPCSPPPPSLSLSAPRALCPKRLSPNSAQDRGETRKELTARVFQP